MLGTWICAKVPGGEGRLFHVEACTSKQCGGISAQSLSQQEGGQVVFLGFVDPCVHPKLGPEVCSFVLLFTHSAEC